MRYLMMLLPDKYLRKVDKYFRMGRHSKKHAWLWAVEVYA